MRTDAALAPRETEVAELLAWGASKKEAAHIGALKALKQSGLKVNDDISQRSAYRRFGEGNVKRWVRLGLLKPSKLSDRNTKVTYSLQELTSIQSTLFVSTNRKTTNP